LRALRRAGLELAYVAMIAGNGELSCLPGSDYENMFAPAGYFFGERTAALQRAGGLTE
jgi:hypothetical protein